MEERHKGTSMNISFSPSLLFMALALMGTGNFQRILIPLLAATLHEVGHFCAAFLLKIPLKHIKLNLFGAIIDADTSCTSYGKEALLCLAGPLSNLLSALILLGLQAKGFAPLSGESTDTFIVSSLALAFLNLLPAESFDGGKILACFLLSVASPHLATYVSELCSFLSFFLLWALSVYFILRTGSYLSLFVFSGAMFAKIFLFEKRSGGL